MASGPTTSWEIDGETVETVSDFIFLGEKIATFLFNLRNHPCNTFVVSKLLPIAFFS